MGDNDFYYYFGTGESKDDPDYIEEERESTAPSSSASSSASSSTSSSKRRQPPATPESQLKQLQKEVKSRKEATINPFDHTAFLASDEAKNPANESKLAEAKRLAQFGPGRMASQLSADEATAEKQKADLQDWPVDGSITPTNPPAFTAASGPLPRANRFLNKDRFKTPLPYFNLFFDDDVIGMLVEHTNIVGRSKYDDWKDCDARTIRALIGTMIRFGKFPATALPTYWHPERGWDPVRRVWSQRRFERIWWSLHMDTSDRPSAAAKHRLWNIEPLLNLLNRNFAATLQPPRNLIMDETMIAYRGKHESFVTIPDKPIKRGFELRTLADSDGYIYRLKLCVGKDAERRGGVPILQQTVLDMVRDYGGEWRIITMDAGFTTQALVEELLKIQTLAVGKVNPRWTFPFHVRNALLLPNQWAYAQHKAHHEMSATAFTDHKRRSEYLSTATPLPMTAVQLQPVHSERSFPAPSVAEEYNKTCGGVDKANNLAAQHTTHRKHMRPWMTFLEYFVNCAMANAWVLYDQFGRQRTRGLPIRTLDEFGWILSDELIGTFKARDRQGRKSIPLSVKHEHFCPPRVKGVRNPKEHCIICRSRSKNQEHDCKTIWRCTCGVAVCNTNPNCWTAHLKAARIFDQNDDEFDENDADDD